MQCILQGGRAACQTEVPCFNPCRRPELVPGLPDLNQFFCIVNVREDVSKVGFHGRCLLGKLFYSRILITSRTNYRYRTR